MFSKDTRIMVVDDMKTIRAVVKKTIESLGFKDIKDFANGETALAELEAAHQEGRPYGVIISDWSMPVMTGLQLLQKVREHEGLKRTPFIMLTAETDIASVKEAIAAGVSNYITKPFTAEMLIAKLEAVHGTQRKSA